MSTHDPEDDMITEENEIGNFDADPGYFNDNNYDENKLDVPLTVPMSELKVEDAPSSPGSFEKEEFAMKKWTYNRYDNDPWVAAVSEGAAPLNPVALDAAIPEPDTSDYTAGAESTPELLMAIEEVTSKIPTVSWETTASAMRACVQLMEPIERNNDVIAFAKECMYQVLYVMVGLNSIDGKPKTMSDLQDMWKEKMFEKFNTCFHEGLGNAIRVLLRIARVSTANELKQWHDWHKEYNRYGAWVNSVEVMLDETRAAYRDRHSDHPNSIYHAVVTAFNEEDGFNVLAKVLDSDIFAQLMPDKQMEREHLFHCKVARLLKRLSEKLSYAMGELAEQNQAVATGKADEVATVMERVNALSANAAEWLRQRLNTAPDKLSNRGKTMDVELLDVLADLMGPEQSIGLAKGLLSVPSLGAQQAGLKLARQLRRHGGATAEAFADLPREFLEATAERFSGTGDDLVKQLLSAQVVNKRAIVETFDELDELMEAAADKIDVCQAWGELGLRCMCTSDERTRDIGIGLLESLNRRHFAHQAKLTAPAEAALDWLKQVCAFEGPELIKSLMTSTLSEADRIVNLLSTLFQVLLVTDSERINEVPELWVSVALSSIRCTDKYPIREMGFVMIQEAVRMVKQMSYSSGVTTSSVLQYKNKLSKDLQTILQSTVEDFLSALFTEHFCHHAVIGLVSSWLVNDYYRDFCYEDDQVDLMKFLVDASVHESWGVVDVVTDLLVKITISNISIKSLNSLCNLFKEAVSDKSTATAGNKLVLTWIDKTRQKKWVMSVQERVLNLLWTMLVTKSSESESDTRKVLDYFKNQFGNIRGHLTEGWCFTGLSEKEVTARNCIRQCAKDCLQEIRKSIGLEAPAEGLTPEDVRSRATQSVLLLRIVLDLVDTLRPDVLREMHEGDEQGMLQGMFDELCASSKFEDVDSSAVFSRLQMLSALCSYLQPNSPLSPEWIGRIWHECAQGVHRPVVLKWMHIVLAPDVPAEAQFFTNPDDAKKARQLVLGLLSQVVQDPDPAVRTLTGECVECLLALFLWVNKDTGAFRADLGIGAASAIGEAESFEVVGEDISAFETLAVAALDFPPESSKSAEYTLLHVSEAIHRAQLTRIKSAAYATLAQGGEVDPALLVVDTEVGLGRYDLLRAIFTRFETTAAADLDPATCQQTNHRLSVLLQYFRRLSEFNGAVSHGHRSLGVPMNVTLMMGDAVATAREIPAHSNMTLKQFLALAVQHAEETGEPVALTGGDAEDVQAAAQARAAGNLKYCLKTTFKTKANQYVFKDTLKGAHLTLGELGVKPNDHPLSLQQDLYAEANEPFTDEDLPAPSDVLASTPAFTDVLFRLLEQPATCEAAWAILQMVPTSQQALGQLEQTAGTPSLWADVLSPSNAFWRSVYSVQIIEGQMLPGDVGGDEAMAEWRRAFVSHGGLQALFALLEAKDLAGMLPFVRAASLGPLVRVVKFCVANALVAEDEEKAQADAAAASADGGQPTLNRQFSGTSQRLVREAVDLAVVMRAMFAVIRIGAAAQLMPGEVSAVSDAIATITVIVKRTERATWETMCQAFPLDVLVRLLLDSPEPRLREQVASTFRELITGPDYVLLDTTDGADGTLRQAEQVLGNLFTSKLWTLPLLSDKSTQFFTLYARLVEGAWFEPQTLFNMLQDKLRQFEGPVMNEEVDSTLVGALHTCAHLVEVKPELCRLETTPAFVRFLFDTFLMKLPMTAVRGVHEGLSHGEARSAERTGPICFTEASRRAVCQLLFALGANDDGNAHVLASLMHDFAVATDPPTDSILCRAKEDLKSYNRPGLHNNANRCYMNSLLQQLTSLQDFREGILAVPVFPAPPREEDEGKDDGAGAAEGGTWDCSVCTLQNDVACIECQVCGAPKPENAKITAPGVDPEEARKAREAEAKERKDVLRQFQRTLRFLSNGEMQYFDAESMLSAVGSSLALMYPAEQQNDTKEFMDKLLEQIELELSGTPFKTLVKQSFGATQAERKTRMHDELFVGRNTTTSTTFSLGLQVENISSVEEAMENYFEPQVREVDDEHDVDEATGKPIKYKFEYKTMFAKLPPVLCVQLSRFSFDYSRGVPIKHNHRVECPDYLDVTKYVEPREGQAPVPCVYRLKGYLIHMGGSASSGHYYSIIRDGETADGTPRWLKYDDNRVSEVPANDIDTECFGGEYQCTTKDTYGTSHVRTREKGWNAYLLFYELQDAETVAAAGMVTGADEEGKAGEPEAKDAEPTEGPAETPEELAEREQTVLRNQEDEVQLSNEKLWRRALLYQPAPLRTFRRLLTAKTGPAALPATPEGQELRRLILRTGYMLYERAVIHCEDVAVLDGEITAWSDKLLALFMEDPEASHQFFDAINRGSKVDAEEASAVEAVSTSVTDLDVDAIDVEGPSPAAGPVKPAAATPAAPAPEEEELAPGQWPSSQLIPQSVLQIGCLRPVREVRDAAVVLVAGVAKGLAAQGQLEQSAFPLTMAKLLGATEQLVHDRDHLDGYVRLFLELAAHESVRPTLVNLDVLAFLAHVYMANLSPASDYTGEDAAAQATGIKLPKLPANTRKTLVSMYSQPLHDYKLLLRALGAVLRPAGTDEAAAGADGAAAGGTGAGAGEAAGAATSGEGGQANRGAANVVPEGPTCVPVPVSAVPLAALPPLSQRVLREPRFISRLVDKDPIAGLKPLAPKEITPQEEDALLLAEGWQRHLATNGKFYWSNKRLKGSSTWEKPKPKGATPAELEEAALEQAVPQDLLIVLLALADPVLSVTVIDALALGIERGYASSKAFDHKLAVLTQLLLALDTEAQRGERITCVANALVERVSDLRDNATTEVRGLKNYQKCSRMEVLVKTVLHLQTSVPGFLEALPIQFDWYRAWMDEYRPALRVTLDDLQGRWRNSHDQDITITGDQCTFANSDPVQIVQDESGTYSVPGWLLSQERSYTGVVYWISTSNRNELTSWTRPSSVMTSNSVSTYAADDLDTNYGPHSKPDNYRML